MNVLLSKKIDGILGFEDISKNDKLHSRNSVNAWMRTANKTVKKTSNTTVIISLNQDLSMELGAIHSYTMRRVQKRIYIDEYLKDK